MREQSQDKKTATRRSTEDNEQSSSLQPLSDQTLTCKEKCRARKKRGRSRGNGDKKSKNAGQPKKSEAKSTYMARIAQGEKAKERAGPKTRSTS